MFAGAANGIARMLFGNGTRRRWAIGTKSVRRYGANPKFR
jgi:hypothetical protein